MFWENPDCIWIPANGECGIICVEVISPWELSDWSEDPKSPPYDPSIDFTNLVESQHHPRVKPAIQRLAYYMRVSFVVGLGPISFFFFFFFFPFWLDFSLGVF